jgi:hypothetical protein
LWSTFFFAGVFLAPLIPKGRVGGGWGAWRTQVSNSFSSHLVPSSQPVFPLSQKGKAVVGIGGLSSHLVPSSTLPVKLTGSRLLWILWIPVPNVFFSGTWNSVPGSVLQTNMFEFWFYQTRFQSDSENHHVQFGVTQTCIDNKCLINLRLAPNCSFFFPRRILGPVSHINGTKNWGLYSCVVTIPKIKLGFNSDRSYQVATQHWYVLGFEEGRVLNNT